ncbi:MAG: RNA methyltransferase [Desulfatiglandaceae bacterium]|jgi:hypothetical protein
MRLYLGLVHYPVYDKNEEKIASAITTVDLHDLSRASRTYAVKQLLVITPLTDQQRLVERVCRHWITGFGAQYNPHRKEAVELISVVSSLKGAIASIAVLEGEMPFVVATGARERKEKVISFAETRSMVRRNDLVFLIFGTAWGLAQEAFGMTDAVLEPIPGAGGYNHLSVRSASAIILDRLAGNHTSRDF